MIEFNGAYFSPACIAKISVNRRPDGRGYVVVITLRGLPDSAAAEERQYFETFEAAQVRAEEIVASVAFFMNNHRLP